MECKDPPSIRRRKNLFTFEKIEEGLKLFSSCGVAHFAQRFGFDLTNALARYFEPDADFFQSLWLAFEKAETLNENGSFAIC